MSTTGLTRRGMLTSALAAAQVTGATDLPGLRLGLATFSLSRWNRAEAIAMIRKLDVRIVNIKAPHLPYTGSAGELAAGRREFEDAGLEIEGGGTIPLEVEDEGDLRRFFEYAKACRFPTMIVASKRKIMPTVERLVKEYDVRVALHNHGPESPDFPTPLEGYEVIRHMDRRVGLCVDVGHTTKSGADLVKCISAVADRIFNLHIWDMHVLTNARTGCDVGDGRMPVRAIFKRLQELRFGGVVLLEQNVGRSPDPVLSLARSLAHMKGVLAGLHEG